MDYQGFSREQLIERIYSLERLTKELRKEQEQETRLEFAWSGNLGHWYWDIRTNTVTFDSQKVTALGYDLTEIPETVTYQFFTDKLHPEDYQSTMEAMMKHLQGEAEVYEVEYRIRTKEGDYKWYYDRGKITQVDEAGKPLFLAGIVFDITEQKEMLMELEAQNLILAEMSSVDSLTKIGNHRTLMEHLKSEMALALRKKTPLTIVMFDVDDFKRINDEKGHIYGDQVLREVAQLLQKSMRKGDLVGRYGGEEFMAIFPHTTLADGKKIAERIRKTVAEHDFISGMRVSLSGGVWEYKTESITELIHAADQQLYEAKRNGKNRVE